MIKVKKYFVIFIYIHIIIFSFTLNMLLSVRWSQFGLLKLTKHKKMFPPLFSEPNGQAFAQSEQCRHYTWNLNCSLYCQPWTSNYLTSKKILSIYQRPLNWTIVNSIQNALISKLVRFWMRWGQQSCQNV